MKVGSLTTIAKKEGGLTAKGKISIPWARKKLRNSRTSAVVKRKLQFFLNMNAPKKSVKRKMVKRNPVPRSRMAKAEKAIQLFMRFRGMEPQFVDEYNAPDLSVAMLIGQCDAVEYTTVREGKTEMYRHEFTGKSKPMLIASWDGKQIGFLGGRYNFSEVGIKDY